MELYMHTDDELRALIKVKYGDKEINYSDKHMVDNCPLARETLFRVWLEDYRKWPMTTPPNIERRFKDVERYLNAMLSELRIPKTYTVGQVFSSYPQNYTPNTFTYPPALQNNAYPTTIYI